MGCELLTPSIQAGAPEHHCLGHQVVDGTLLQGTLFFTLKCKSEKSSELSGPRVAGSPSEPAQTHAGTEVKVFPIKPKSARWQHLLYEV